MKRIGAILLCMTFLCTTPVLAAPDGSKGASPKAMEQASGQAVFSRIGDWFSTVGKSDEEKTKILEERKAQRMARKKEKEAKKEAKKLEKKAAKKVDQKKNKAKKAKGKAKKGMTDMQNKLMK